MKQEIYKKVKRIIDERIFDLKFAMDAAQASANNEGKSSAGDKYETGRAMGQIEVNMYGNQLQNARNDLSVLNSIDIEKPNKIATLGSFIETDFRCFFIAVSIGEMVINEKKIIVCSPNSPIGQLLKGKKVGDSFEFLGKLHAIAVIE